MAMTEGYRNLIAAAGGTNPISVSRISFSDVSTTAADSIYVFFAATSVACQIAIGAIAIGRWKA